MCRIDNAGSLTVQVAAERSSEKSPSPRNFSGFAGAPRRTRVSGRASRRRVWVQAYALQEPIRGISAGYHGEGTVHYNPYSGALPPERLTRGGMAQPISTRAAAALAGKVTPSGSRGSAGIHPGGNGGVLISCGRSVAAPGLSRSESRAGLCHLPALIESLGLRGARRREEHSQPACST